MRKTELLRLSYQKLSLRNYSRQTIKSQISAIQQFADWLISTRIKVITSQVVEQYLSHFKNNHKRSISTLKQTVAALMFVFSEVLNQDIPAALNTCFRNEERLTPVSRKPDSRSGR